VTSSVRAKMNQFTPIDDGTSNNQDYDDQMKNSKAGIRPLQQKQQSEEFVAIVDHVAEQEERAQKMENMVQGVQDLNEAVNDLNELVVDQQSDINKLDVNVDQTKVQVVQANENLTAAERYQKLAREKQCYIIICCVVLIGVILLGVCLSPGVCHK